MDELLRQLNEAQAVHNLRADYQKTLILLAALKAGKIQLEQVALMGDGWRLLDIKIDPAELQPVDPVKANPVDLTGEEAA
jgi:hypothetical protein